MLITGASGGLGEGLAKELYKRGARLILVARSVVKLKVWISGNIRMVDQELISLGAM